MTSQSIRGHISVTVFPYTLLLTIYSSQCSFFVWPSRIFCTSPYLQKKNLKNGWSWLGYPTVHEILAALTFPLAFVSFMYHMLRSSRVPHYVRTLWGAPQYACNHEHKLRTAASWEVEPFLRTHTGGKISRLSMIFALFSPRAVAGRCWKKRSTIEVSRYRNKQSQTPRRSYRAPFEGWVLPLCSTLFGHNAYVYVRDACSNSRVHMFAPVEFRNIP